MNSGLRFDVNRSVGRHLWASSLGALLLVGGVGGWSVATEIAGAVVAPGTVVVESHARKVQHPTGGVVGELRVRDGTLVAAGEVVVRLDETVTRANLAVIDKSLIELGARHGRLEAERDGKDRVTFDEFLAVRSSDADIAKVLVGEVNLFELRRTARVGQKAQLTERTGQLREEIQGLNGQASAKQREIQLIARELEAVRELWRKNLMTLQRVTQMEREAARLEGEHGQLMAAIAQAKGKISETQLQIIQIDQDLRSEVAKELREIQGKMAELTEKRVAAEDQVKRIDIRAPQDGMVHQLKVHTVGGVINAGETIMLIVPKGDNLVVEAKISPREIDQIRQGQVAMLRFTAFNQRTTPEVSGRVSFVAADQSTDEKAAVTYFRVQITPEAWELGRLRQVKLLPGMPAEAFIQTGERTVLSYFLKPLTDQISKAFRES